MTEAQFWFLVGRVPRLTVAKTAAHVPTESEVAEETALTDKK